MAQYNNLSKPLFEINGKLEKVTSKINSAKNSLVAGNIYGYEEDLSDAVSSLENTCLALRKIAGHSLKMANNPLGYQRIMDKLSQEVYKISIQKEDGIYHISIPQTIPHYREITKCVIVEPLRNALKKYFKDQGIEKIGNAVLVFINHVDKEKNDLKIRDNDNYEYKSIVNELAFWFLPDDSFKCCNMFSTTRLSDKSGTEVFIVPTDRFGCFYKDHLDQLF